MVINNYLLVLTRSYLLLSLCFNVISWRVKVSGIVTIVDIRHSRRVWTCLLTKARRSWRG